MSSVKKNTYQYDITVRVFTAIHTYVQHKVQLIHSGCVFSIAFVISTSNRIQVSEWLWIDQEDALAPDEELVDVACANSAICPWLFLHRDFFFLLFGFHAVWWLGLCRALPSIARVASRRTRFAGFILDSLLLLCQALLDRHLFKELQ